MQSDLDEGGHVIIQHVITCSNVVWGIWYCNKFM